MDHLAYVANASQADLPCSWSVELGRVPVGTLHISRTGPECIPTAQLVSAGSQIDHVRNPKQRSDGDLGYGVNRHWLCEGDVRHAVQNFCL